MEIEKIKPFIKEYLNSKNIEFEKKHEKDECSLVIKELGNFYYVEIHASYFIGILYPGDENYPAQAGGIPCNYIDPKPSYGLLFDKNGNVVIDLTEICKDTSASKSASMLDENNIIVPIKGKSSVFNDIQHYRIENGKFTLVNTVSENVTLSNSFNVCYHIFSKISDELTKNGIIELFGNLYNFKEGAFLKFNFDGILISDPGIAGDIADLASCWKIPIHQKSEFIKAMHNIMTQNNLICGYREVKVSKCGYTLGYDTILFVDKNGNPAGSLFYVDEYDFTSIDGINAENYESAIKELENRLESKIDKIVAEKEKINELFPQIIRRLSLKNSSEDLL